MRILTIVKQVPDSNATIKIAASGTAIETAGLKLVMNPFDEFAVEQAIQLREKGQPVEEIVALTIGDDKAAEILRTALAMGADRALHVCDPTLLSHDEVYLAEILALAIQKQPQPFDLILTGKQAIDMDAGEIGPALAEFLNRPHVGAVVGLEISGKQLKARRRVEGAEEYMEVELPALLTCEKGLCEPRYPSLPNLMKAKKKPLDTLKAADLPGVEKISRRSELVAMQPPAARKGCKFVEGEPAQMAKELVRLLREEAKVV
ncbi:MAG: Electron transfer flavoprotein subunit beta [Phycisphaerae bacterium]|nr:Electron transfer flavoprotein subunit beta [Phycisphaerae bacterium]